MTTMGVIESARRCYEEQVRDAKGDRTVCSDDGCTNCPYKVSEPYVLDAYVRGFHDALELVAKETQEMLDDHCS